MSDDGPAVPTRKLEEIEIQKLYKDFHKKKWEVIIYECLFILISQFIVFKIL